MRSVGAEKAAAAPNWRQTVWVAAGTQLAALIGFGLVIPFLPLYVQALGVHDRAEVAVWSGVLAGAASLSMAIVSPVWGAVADRYGRKLMLVRSMLGGALLLAGMGFASDVGQVLVLRLLQGGLTGSIAAASAVVAAVAPAAQLGFALGLLNTAVQVGSSVGPGIGGAVVAGLGFRGAFVLSGAMLAVGGLMALVWIQEPPRRSGQQRPDSAGQDGLSGNWLRRTLQPFTWPEFRFLLALQLGTQFALSATWVLLPLFLQDMERPEWLSPELASGLAVTLTAVAGAAATPFVGRWIDARDARGLLTASLLGSALVLGAQALVPHVGLVLVLRLALGVGVAGLTTTLAVLTKRAAPGDSEGAAYGAASTAQALGWGLGPMLGSVFAAFAGIPALYLVTALVLAALALPAVRQKG